MITDLIDVATAYLDGPTGIGVAMLTQQYRLSLDALPLWVSLLVSPFQSVDSITIDGDVVGPSTYYVDTDSTPALVFNETPRYFDPRGRGGRVKITFTAGFGDDPMDVPADLKHAIKLLIGHLYEHREATSEISLMELPFGVQTIFNRYRAFG